VLTGARAGEELVELAVDRVATAPERRRDSPSLLVRPLPGLARHRKGRRSAAPSQQLYGGPLHTITTVGGDMQAEQQVHPTEQVRARDAE
jgi:hypothetical protein